MTTQAQVRATCVDPLTSIHSLTAPVGPENRSLLILLHIS